MARTIKFTHKEAYRNTHGTAYFFQEFCNRLYRINLADGGKTHILSSQLKRYVAKLFMYTLTVHFRYTLTEVAITMEPFEAPAKFEDVQVEMLWTTELACYIGNFIQCA